MKTTSIDPDSLAGSAQALAGTADDVADGLDELQRTVTTDSPWGADEPGTIFGMAYTAVLGHAVEAYGTHVEQLVFAAEGLMQMAERMSAADLSSAQGLTQLSHRIGG